MPMNTRINLPVDSIFNPCKMSFVLAESLTLPERRELINLLNTSYGNWGINKVFEQYPCTQQLYVFRLWTNNTLIASRQIMIVDYHESAPEWSLEMARALAIQRFAIGSRAIVHPNFRNQGLGRTLVHKVNQEAFSTHKVDTILGSSTSIGALSLYLRQGIRLWNDDVDDSLLYNLYTYSGTNTSDTNKKNRDTKRLSQPVRYVYHRPEIQNFNNEYLWPANTSELRKPTELLLKILVR